MKSEHSDVDKTPITIRRGNGYHVMVRGMSIGGDSARRNILMTGQFNMAVPNDVSTVEVRFVRVYADGTRDNTGEVDLYCGHRKGKSFQWTWSHPVADGPFKVDIEARVTGVGPVTFAYFMGKVSS